MFEEVGTKGRLTRLFVEIEESGYIENARLQRIGCPFVDRLFDSSMKLGDDARGSGLGLIIAVVRT